MVQVQLKDDDNCADDVEKTNGSKPLLLPQDYSDKQVNVTVTSMDSALSNSDNCSDIELENIQKTTEASEESEEQQQQQQLPQINDTSTYNPKPRDSIE